MGLEIAATCAAWSLGGWFLGNRLSETWPVVAFSLAGVVHSVFALARSASRKP